MVENQPKVSVILPTLNSKEYIEECIESILNQTLDDIEIIVVDAGSTDGTLEIIKDYARNNSKLNVFLSSKKSYGGQVNQGMSNARGEYISIVESDDFIKEDMLESLYALCQYGYIDIVKGTFYHYYDTKEDENCVVDTAKRTLPENKIFRTKNQPLFLEGHPSIWAGIYRKSFLKNYDIKFVEEEGGAWVDNPFFYETSLKAETIIYTNTPYYYYRETNENSSTNNLKDKSVPARRIIDMFKLVNESNCDDNIRQMLFRRLFRYIEITVESNDDRTDTLDNDTCKAIYEALQYVDEDFVRKNLSTKEKINYYKFSSPLILSQSN